MGEDDERLSAVVIPEEDNRVNEIADIGQSAERQEGRPGQQLVDGTCKEDATVQEEVLTEHYWPEEVLT